MYTNYRQWRYVCDQSCPNYSLQTKQQQLKPLFQLVENHIIDVLILTRYDIRNRIMYYKFMLDTTNNNNNSIYNYLYIIKTLKYNTNYR